MKKGKRVVLSAFLFLLLGVIAACGKSSEQVGQQLQVFYLNKEETEIISMPYEAVHTPKEREDLVRELLNALESQPKEPGLQSAIRGFLVKDCIVRESQVTLNFSKEYEMQHFTREVLARAAIVKTLTQLDFVQLVLFQVEGKNLADSLGEEVGVLSSDSFLDNTGQEMKKYEETTINLYFANATGDSLVKVNRKLHYNTNISLEKLVVEQIVAGPLNSKNYVSEIYPTVNKETKIIGVSVKDGICYVNLSNHFLTPMESVTPDITLFSLVNSLTELPGIVKVQFAIEGDTKVTFGEKYQFTALFERNLQLTKEGRSNE
ncbi:MAG: GerMN domain-containing protein [Lachnospiraceae bacterium]|nr:GerMN domain-containing protein [Lachnospiraceae bacterium]